MNINILMIFYISPQSKQETSFQHFAKDSQKVKFTISHNASLSFNIIIKYFCKDRFLPITSSNANTHLIITTTTVLVPTFCYHLKEWFMPGAIESGRSLWSRDKVEEGHQATTTTTLWLP